ncbi:dTDP-4-dehydro-6-deoxyglucose aminotransferase [bacterium]|nr:dTDP-4-dehydro-6-deoxyglucose aminotransferase [bacterium]
MRRLALLGGEPAFATALHVGRPNIGDRERFFAYANQMFDSRRLTNSGPLVEEFEQELCRFLGVKHCIPVCNATAGLQIAIRSLGMQGEVIMPSFTFIATAHALQWQGITPVFADIDPQTYTLDPDAVEASITPRTTGIIGVHLWGRSCDVDGLARVASRHNLKLLYDAAHAFGCGYRGRMLGTFGDAEVFSFHATKFFNTFEGGAISTEDDAPADLIRLQTDFGFSGYDKVESIGTNGKMTEVAAAMGLTNLASLDHFISANLHNYQTYQRVLADIPGLTLITDDSAECSNYQYVIVDVDAAKAGLSRDTLLRVLHAENVLARRYFWPGCHEQEPYRTLYPEAGQRLPHTRHVAERVLTLPTGTAVGPQEIESIGDILRTAVASLPRRRE